jgi:hypothetical protein
MAPPETSPSKVARKRTQRSDEDETELTPEQSSPLDATHTSAEKIVYSIMYRETISKGTGERHFGPAELMKKTGIRSRNTVHKALYGLLEKLSVEVVTEAKGNPLGPRYRIFKPQVIEQRRKNAGIKIDQQSKRIVERGTIPDGIPDGIPVNLAYYPKNWDTTLPKIGIPTIPKIGIVIKKENNSYVEPPSATASSSNALGLTGADDEAFAPLVLNFKQATKDITGRESSAVEAERWRELSELLVTELKIAAARTGSVSSVPAFLTEHLRRRLWKKDKQEFEHDTKAGKPPSDLKAVDASKCPDCGGSGFWYPEGFEKGVARCAHEGLAGVKEN